MKKDKLTPDLEAFNQAVINSVYGREYTGTAVAQDFRALMLRDPGLGKRVLHMLLHWCGEFDNPPEENELLQRWAGKRELAARIKAAMYADLSTPAETDEEEDILNYG